ncbi:MAG: RNA polymerase ECF-like protein sigma factor [Candidatus Gottesmanbacteria bacterium GW2011_GWB1_43_11]|uniref:RNA polymerase ECF-like protein sigma factor n=1 Tax=Candidatus Gottesmanbacteria bacterium GW2011_GWB1_43_11 TaxID=1618446 RepID=A0A0G1FHY4_9BACT|nr:MAG: RNA polymerase ECF-like protein sigma factor [Candidatus Gottesmanbacteria bacterium GW2011_GWA2_42_16]KKS53535.1 MAG: RNA polymerase ECF-like protein sigma factor [Candidatus Gottesmanbacteria bacterium GW2011_GWA1_42_26]KKS81209.1 MAG: RNA polymerase ECF-like protein sigma factor [Candidatus Gottesmanbacteria bacterium GW2011_GWC1_43_10]KKS86468.1 MAG: RNA polymerase ECF-like protein sigma factor [Candidatus Gottesmanbacteria bacterium GW2011_GWB1_43_11]OGG10113.1 MAG: hypothetical pr
MSEDTELLHRLLHRDKGAVREFYQKYSMRLINFIRKRIASEQDTEEIAQDTLFAFLEGARDFTGRCSLNTYLCSIANNKIVDFYRKRRLKRIVFSQLPEGLEPLISELADPQKIFDNTLLKQKIKQVFNKLTPHYAQTLKLKYVEGRSVAEIAEMLSISFKSAESVLFRARKAFVKLYIEG